MTTVPTILVVEDNPVTRKMLRVTLATEGYAVIEAADARSALAAVDKGLPDLVLQDFILPDMDGLELLRRLRMRPGGSGLQILALSGFLSRLEETQTGRGGFTALLVKPIEPSRLVDAIHLYLPEQPVDAACHGDGRRLLVVDDDPVQLKLTRIHFSQLGFEVFAAGGALDALIAARANRPDVILSDIFMPGTDGFELCLEIRRDPKLAKIPVVLLSALYGSEADEDMARRVGASALVLRTPDFERVVPAVVEALGTSGKTVSDQPRDQLALGHARVVIGQLERQVADMTSLTRRCAIQAAELSLLSGVANALTHKSDADLAVREVLAATLDAAGISKGALMLRDASGALALRQAIGFSEAERSQLANFFGHGALLDDIVKRGGSVSVPSPAISVDVSRGILAGANVAVAQIVPLVADGRGVGAMVIGGSRSDVIADDSVAFARAMGNQLVQSLELARSVARLAASEQRYRTLLENANDFVALLTPDGVVRELNRRWVDLTGLPLEQLIGRHVHEFAPPGHGEQTADTDDCVEIARQDGSSAFIEFSRTGVDVGGESLVFTIGRDVTERHRAVQALRTSEERMRFALQNADVGIWDMDYRSGVLRWSETLEAHYGVKPGTFGGTLEAFVECVHPDDRASLLETLAASMKSGADFSVQNRSLWPDGTIRWLNGIGRVLLGEHGEPVRGVGISLDVTDRRTLEAQYQQAQKMEAVGRLAGGVAHDFNNLLTVILGYCELLLVDFKPGDPHFADIAEVQKAGARAGGLTRQLLAFSRKQIIEPALLDFNLIATDLRAMLGRLIGEDIKVVLQLQTGLPLVKADRGQVEQIVMNLAVNARDAMPTGGRLTIETESVELDEPYSKTHLGAIPGAYVALTVTDTGTGMTPEVQARLFEPFFTTKEPGKGTGLGMATVYGIVSQAGGSVAVQSEVGKGTSFKIFFPPADAAEVVVSPGPVVARARTGTQTVLVVEDEAGLRQLTKRLLARQGYTVLVAADANEALRLFEDNPSIDVLLTDVVMPGPSGPDLTKQLVEQRPELRVIYMSGYTEERIVHHGVLKPGIAFLHKPFTSETLGQKIREALDR